MRCGLTQSDKPNLVGDPVDVVTGANVDSTTDFQLPATIPIRWRRYYHSGRLREMGSLGNGHKHHYDRQLVYDIDGISYINESGDRIPFELPEIIGGCTSSPGLRLELVADHEYRLFEVGQPVMEFRFLDANQPAQLLRLVSAGQAQILEYTENGVLSAIHDPSGVTIRVSADQAGRVTELVLIEVSGATKNLMQYTYDGRGNLTRGTDAYGHSLRFEYDAHDRLICKTDRRNYSFYFKYDDQGRCVHSRGQDGLHEVRLEYQPEQKATRVTRGDGGLWLYFYDEQGAVTQIIDPYGGTTAFSVDETGRILEEIGPNGHTTRLVYAPDGRLLGRRSSSGPFVREIDAQDDHLSEHRVPQSPAEWEFGDFSGYSDESRESMLEDRSVYSDGFSPDLLERLDNVAVTNGVLDTRDGRRYDRFGFLLSESDDNGTQRRWVYNQSGNVDRYVDRDRARFTFEYSSWDVPSRIVDPNGNPLVLEHGISEQITRVTDAGGTVTEFRYDLKGRVIEVYINAALLERYVYDVADNLVQRIDSNGTVLLTQEFGADNLVTRQTFGSGEEYLFSYDDQGRFTSIEAGDHNSTFEYDSQGRTVADERDGRGVRHEYLGSSLWETRILERFIARYSWDHGKLKIVDPSGAAHTLSSNRGRVIKQLANGARETVTFSNDGQCLLRDVEHTDGRQPVWRREYAYSAEGDLVSVLDSRAGKTEYWYDAAHRLVRVIHADGSEAVVQYDAAGNVRDKPGCSDISVGQGNQLATANASHFVYDNRGAIAKRTSAEQSIQYTYDAADQLSSVVSNDRRWTARYDALARRISKRYAGRETIYYWDSDRLAAEIRPDRSLRVYIYSDAFALVPLVFVDYESVDAEPSSGRCFFVFYDHLSCPVEIQNGHGEVVWHARADPFGATRIDSESRIEFSLRFPGQFADDETGLHYNRFRYYSPELGRYLEADPEGLEGSLNQYAYCAYPLFELDVRGDRRRGDCGPPGGGTGKKKTKSKQKKPRRSSKKKKKRRKSLREKYLGRTPSKKSRTGREVIARMESEKKIRTVRGKKQFQASDGNWYPLKDADMAHRRDAVKYWNKSGRSHGPKSPQVRKWMLDSKNYELDHYSLNRSSGAQLPDRYKPPL